MALRQAMSLTDAAADRIRAPAGEAQPAGGGHSHRRCGRSAGCSGLTYTVEYADEKGKLDEVVAGQGRHRG